MKDQLSFELIEDSTAPPSEPPCPEPPRSDSPSSDPPPTDEVLREEQRVVVELASDYVVTAGAGSGKTRTLVALYSALLGDPTLTGSDETIGPQRILCLTFTERAARELMRKVRDRTTDPRWRRELETAPISTFHGWCADLLRRYPLEAGVDPRFTVLSEEAAEELLRGAALHTLRSGLESGDEAARLAVETLGLATAAGLLTDLVISLRTAGWSPRAPIERFEGRLADAERRLAPLRHQVETAAVELIDAAREAGLGSENKLAAFEHFFEGQEAAHFGQEVCVEVLRP